MSLVDHHRPSPICGFYFVHNNKRCWLPQVNISAHTTILASTSRTTLTQTFVLPSDAQNPSITIPPSNHYHHHIQFNPFCRGIFAHPDHALEELRYTFPLHDGVSVVAFTCGVNDRTITGVVRERREARATYDAAVAAGSTAGLLEQNLFAADVFTTSIGNVPAGATVVVKITYLGELKHDAEVDGLRLTIPTSIAPRYGAYPGEMVGNVTGGEAMEILVDAEMPVGASIKSVQSPSHPISVSIGTTSRAMDAEPSLGKASAKLALGTTQLDRDFVLQVVATNLGEPSAVVETHPTIKDQKALMATLVPKFSLPNEHPEIVFVCDRSGSMSGKIAELISALRIFLKSLPLGVRFNICSFGSSYSFLFERSQAYGQDTLRQAMSHVGGFDAGYGGTKMFTPIEETFRRRCADVNLEVFVLTDGQITAPDQLFGLINTNVTDSKGAARVFSIGIGASASSSLVEGIARAGNGFAQMVANNEAMDRKMMRMLRGALTPHITDYKLEVKWDREPDDEYDMVEKGGECLVFQSDDSDFANTDHDHEHKHRGGSGLSSAKPKKPISLFDRSVDQDAPLASASETSMKLPPAAPPKLMQAPHDIPPLFPFSRTTVYLLLAGRASTLRIPTCIILRGTCGHGPLELEIPVTDVGVGETIHQLAARKAIKELEEGRGWIHHAKDRDDNLFKSKYASKFDDMVKREAVRMGVDFGVGGKWCSFVAVEEGFGEKPAEILEGATEEEPPAASVCFSSDARRRSGGGGALYSDTRSTQPDSLRALRCKAASSAYRSSGASSTVGGTLFRGMAPPAAASPVPAPVSSPSGATARLGSYAALNSVAQPGAGEEGLFGSAHPISFGAPWRPVIGGGLPGSEDGDFGATFGSPPAATPARDDVGYAISVQRWDGSWTWSQGLGAIIGVAAHELSAFAGQDGALSDLVATALVVAWLEKRCVDRKEIWEMVVEKARGWAQDKGDLDRLVGAVSASV